MKIINHGKSRLSFLFPLQILFLFLACGLFYPVLARSADYGDLPPEIRSIMEAPRYQYARWGLLVMDPASGKAVHSVNADTLFGPASVTKLFTAAAALDGLGPDFSIKTTVYRQGPVDKSGHLKGHLILAAGGDIFFSDLRGLARQIRASGIKVVKGEIVVDDRLFNPYRAYSVARPGKLLYVLSPAVVHNNIVDIAIRPTRLHGAAAVTWSPVAKCLRVSSRVRTISPLEPEKIDIEEDTAGGITVSGQIPENGAVATRKAPVTDPPSLLRSLLIDALKKEGLRVQASPGRSNPAARLPHPDDTERTLTKVAERISPPLSEYLRTILKSSHNQGADMLPLLLAAHYGRHSFTEGMKLQQAFLAKAGVDPKAVSFGDGAGISPANLVTPGAVVQLLTFMTRQKDYAVFREGLPLLGVDGTLSGAIGEGSPARGKVAAKTGTIGLFDLANDSGFVQIKSLAGYLTSASGRPLVFALFVNHVHVVDAPDQKSVLKLTNEVGADLARIAELICLLN